MKQELSYDPWGRLRDPNTQQVYAVGAEPTLFLARGYTGHEHLSVFGLINMNARLYDPALGRFLSPDPYVQSPDNSQNFNRYSYCLNNPLRYSDPSGMITWNDVIAGVAIVAGIVLEFIPLGWTQVLGTSLIVTGFSHFALTINGVQNSHGQTSWNQASNDAGINFSGSIGFNHATIKENRYSGNTSAGNGKSGDLNIPDQSQDAYIPTDLLTISQVKDISLAWSKDINNEIMVYSTSKGWYFEKTEGWVFDAADDNYAYKRNYHTDDAYYGNSYSLEYSSSGHKDQVRPSNDPRTWSTLYWSAHTHPFDGLSSSVDLRAIYNDTRRPVFTWGWRGTDGFIMNGVSAPIYFLRYYK